jgi:hypothetical protein
VFHRRQETNRANRLATGFWCLPPPAIPSMNDWLRVSPGGAGRCRVWAPKTARLGSEDALRLLSPSAGKDKCPCRGRRRGSQSNSWDEIQVDAWNARAPAARVLGNKHQWPPDFDVDAICLTNSRSRGLVLVMSICVDCAPPRHSVQIAP